MVYKTRTWSLKLFIRQPELELGHAFPILDPSDAFDFFLRLRTSKKVEEKPIFHRSRTHVVLAAVWLRNHVAFADSISFRGSDFSFVLLSLLDADLQHMDRSLSD